ncbi:MAG: carboxypeptidase [Ginsengibacter sp.]
MKKILPLLTLVFSFNAALLAQRSPSMASGAQVAAKQEKSSSGPVIAPESAVVTKASVTIKGQQIPYTATAGTLPVLNDDQKAIATLFYTFYERSDIKDRSTRPLVISFNGGPGSASVWMEIGYTGPRILNIDDEGYPVQPYGMRDNPYSIIDVADIVFVNPVNTAFSRILENETPGSRFFGINADIKYLAEWINLFVTRNNRWASPKYLIGESYGTVRVSGLAHMLQSSYWMYLNGVVLVSPTDLGIARSGPVADALTLPFYAATAWYHKMLSPDLQNKPLTEMLPEVENFTINELIPALSKGHSLSETERKKIAGKIARYSGISEKNVLQQNLVIPINFFWKDLLRDKGFTVGRLDSRYRGIDKQDAGERPDYNAELTSWLHSFTPAINMYLREELNFKTDLKYNMFGSVHPWDNTSNRSGENLRQAMAQNPYLHVLVQSGYYDGACDYFSAKYNLWQMDPGGKLKDRMDWKGFESGHMMYLRRPDLEESNEQLREFFKKSIPKKGTPARF